MTQLGLTFTVIAIITAAFAIWLNTRKGKKMARKFVSRRGYENIKRGTDKIKYQVIWEVQ